MDWQTLRCERRGGVALVTLDRPGARNALDETMRRELPQLLQQLREDEAVRAVVLQGAGDHFCAGGDLRAMSAKPRTAYQSRQRIHALHEWLPAWANLEKPVIAAVDGSAFGGGFSLALLSDFVLATPRARFCQVFARIGLVPDMAAMYLLPRIVGLQRAKELMFSARVLPAAEAQALGIVYALHEPEDLLAEAMALAQRFTEASPLAIGMTKNILNQSFQLDQRAMAELESYAQGLCMDSDYHRDAVRRFLAREPLAFPGLDAAAPNTSQGDPA
ncbi:MAG: enoyl-CoA hydratase/isomerase family protein [Comamonas sp.]